MEKENDRKVLDFFMDDSTWEEIPGKKTVLKKQRVEKPPVNQQNKIIKSKREDIVVQKELTKENPDEKNETANPENEFGEVDYAILKSVTYGFKTIKEIAGALQIRTMVIEKHVYELIKNGYIKYFQYCVITSKGKQAIEDFVLNNHEDVWQPIDEFIVSVIEQKKERNLKLQKMIDIILLISIIVLIILIIYFGIFA